MLAEPPFPLCPCWVCLGDFDCISVLCGKDIPAEIIHMISTSPGHWLRSGGPKAAAIRMIRRYQTEVSAHRPARCPFVPSCSHYGIDALERYGALRGGWLIIKRLWRCRSTVLWGTADPVPMR
jgi:putative membrane protein insertion efficiency factor